jgi:dTMP kinase
LARHEVVALSGTLVTVCGLDGSGKSTVIDEALAILRRNGTAPPERLRPLAGDGELVDAVSEVYKQAGRPPSPDGCDFFGAYFSHVLAASGVTIRRLLDGGTSLVCDRYLASHLANQRAFGNDLTAYEPLLATLPKPHVAFYVDVPVEAALERIRARGTRGRGDDPVFLERTRAEYARLERELGLTRLDGLRAPAELGEQIAAAFRGDGEA